MKNTVCLFFTSISFMVNAQNPLFPGYLANPSIKKFNN